MSILEARNKNLKKAAVFRNRYHRSFDYSNNNYDQRNDYIRNQNSIRESYKSHIEKLKIVQKDASQNGKKKKKSSDRGDLMGSYVISNNINKNGKYDVPIRKRKTSNVVTTNDNSTNRNQTPSVRYTSRGNN